MHVVSPHSDLFSCRIPLFNITSLAKPPNFTRALDQIRAKQCLKTRNRYRSIDFGILIENRGQRFWNSPKLEKKNRLN